jgi:hypothetical protein
MPERLASCRLPRGAIRFRADAEAWLRAAGYFDAGGARGRSVFHATASRENATLAAGPRGAPVFEKRNRRITLSDLRKASRRAGRPTWPLLHEWTMLWRARERGVRVPEPVAAGMTRGVLFPRSDFLVTETLAGRSLFESLDGIVAGPARDQHRLAAAVGRAVGGLHAAGITFPDLYAKHVHLEPDGSGGWRVGFLDLASAYEERGPSRAARARDLGALAASLPFRVRTGLLASGLRAYLEGAGGWRFRDAWALIAAGARDVLRLRRFRAALAEPAGAEPRRPAPERELLRRFRVPVVTTTAVAAAMRDDLAEPLKRLLLATFRAGVLPDGDVLPHVVRDGDGALAWTAGAPLVAPRKAREIHARWRIRSLRRELAGSGFSPSVRASIARWLGGEPVAAFALTARRL